MKYYLNLLLFFLLFSLTFNAHAGITWIEGQKGLSHTKLAVGNALTPPPREYFSLNTLYLGRDSLVQVGHDLINQNYVVMPSPNIVRMEKVGDKVRVTVQQYFPELENKIFSSYNISPDKLSFLYITSYEVYDQDGNLVDRIVMPEGSQYRPPQFYHLELSDKVKILSFVFGFTGRSAWSDSGINTDLQGVYRSLTDIGVNRDAAIHLEINPGNGLKTYEVLTSNENVKLQEVLSEFHHIVVWGRLAQKEELIEKIIDLKNFEQIDIDFARGIEDLKKYPKIFGDPLDPKWQSVINHISSERLTENEVNSESGVSAKLKLGSFFGGGGSSSHKRNTRLKEMVKFDVQGNIYIPKSLHFVVRANESLEIVKNLVFQAYDHLEEANFKIGVGVSLDTDSLTRAKSDRLLPGQILKKGESLVSNNGLYELAMQEDGNLVLYQKGPNNSVQWLWDDKASAGKAVMYSIMQSDGNFVVYDYNNTAIWNTQTGGHPGAFLVVQDDSNLVLYQGTRAIWARYGL